MLFARLTAALLPALVSAKLVQYNWNIQWRWLDAETGDGLGPNARPVVTVNGNWPPPTIEADLGDRIKINIFNALGNETTSIHFHGMFMRDGNTYQHQMDGPAQVTQCPIPPGSSFVYDFKVTGQVGTYWWHSHVPGQTADGLRGPMVIHDPSPPYGSGLPELLFTLADWYYEEAPYLINFYQSVQNVAGAEPIPDCSLLNDGTDKHISVQPNTDYLVRIVNLGNFVGAYFEIDGHQMTVVAVDGVYVDQGAPLDRLYLTAAQRYDVLIHTKPDASQNFIVRGQLDTSMFDTIPDPYNPNVYAYLMYNDTAAVPSHNAMAGPIVPTDDMQFTPRADYAYEEVNALSTVDHRIVFDVDFADYAGINRGTFNGSTYIPQKVPTLYTALSMGALAQNSLVYGVNSNSVVLQYGEVVELIVRNFDPGHHPFHLHGQTFQVFERSPENVMWDLTSPPIVAPKTRPMRRDTVQILAGGYASLRFRATNPGVHLFHCHIEWHIEAGLTATLIVGPEKLQQQPLTIPWDHRDACQRQSIPIIGNAAGNMGLNMTGAFTDIDRNPVGAVIDPATLGPPRKRRTKWPRRGKHHTAPASPHFVH